MARPEKTGSGLSQIQRTKADSIREEGSPLIEVNRLSIYYDQPSEAANWALRNISFRISAGEGVGVFGESGAGKSTLALALMGLLPQTARVAEGAALLYGRDLLIMQEDELRKVRGAKVALISQEPAAALNPAMRVGDQISEVLRAHRRCDPKRRRQVVGEMLRQVRLPESRQVYSCYPHELSGGEQQRVAIAQALICQPALILADEPGSALDTSRRAEVFDCLKDAKNRLDMAILMITHDPMTLVGLADRVLVLRKGELVEDTTVARVLAHPIHSLPRTTVSTFTSQPCSGPVSNLDKAHDHRQTPSGLSPEILEDGYTRMPCDPAQLPLLFARQLFKTYQKRRSVTGSLNHVVEALNGVSLSLRAGSITCLVGESGAGKSTLAKCLALLEAPDSGEIRFQGCDLLRLSRAKLRQRRRSIQLVMQDTIASFNPSLTIENTIAEPLNLIGLPRAIRQDRTVALMEKVGLPELWRRRKPQHLSGGQRQRLAIARALAAGPTVLIFDEALNGLDLAAQGEMIELLRKLREPSSLAYLFITHNLDLARCLADEIAVMHAGRIVEYGPPLEVLRCRRRPLPPSCSVSVTV